MVYRNKIPVSLDDKLYIVDSKWRKDGTPHIPSRYKLEWFDDDVLDLDDIKPLDRLKYFRAYPDEELVTKEFLMQKENELNTIRRIYHDELLERCKITLADLKKGTKVKCAGRNYYFVSLMKSERFLSILAVCYYEKEDGTPSKRSRDIPLRSLEIPDNQELTTLLRSIKQ